MPSCNPQDVSSNGDTQPFLTVDRLSFSYGAKSALSNVALAVKEGEILGLLGPNGSGKSTLLALIGGLLRHQSGTLCMNEVPVNPYDAQFRRTIGFVFQNLSLDQKLTVHENLLLAAKLYGVNGKPALDAIREQLALVDLTDQSKQIVKKLSGGMKRRIDIARALVHHPKLLLLDEPTTGLDTVSFHRLWDHLQTLCAHRSLTILVSTHRAEEADRCHRVAILNQGSIVTVDSPHALRRRLSKDVIVLESTTVDLLIAPLAEKFQLSCTKQNDQTLLIEAENGHEYIPRIVEHFPVGTIRSISLRQPSLADVYLKLTGSLLTNSAPEGAAS